MGSAWIIGRTTRRGEKRYRVEYRLGGRESRTRYGGSFKRKAEAEQRARWIVGELAARRVPDLATLETRVQRKQTLSDAAEAWRASRLDVAPATAVQHRVSVTLIVNELGPARPVDEITAGEIATAVAVLAQTHKRETIRKAVNALGMTLDHAGVTPNPARDKVTVRLPREAGDEVSLVESGQFADSFRQRRDQLCVRGSRQVGVGRQVIRGHGHGRDHRAIDR